MRSIFFLLTFLSLLSCRDELQLLPSKTETGRGAFGCKVDGEVFKALSIFGSNNARAYVSDSTCFINALNEMDGNSVGIVLSEGQETLETEEYQLQSESLYREFSWASYSDGEPGGYYTTNDHSGVVTLTKFDTINNIISGTFFFEAENSEGEVVKVRDGRFDLTYQETRRL